MPYDIGTKEVPAQRVAEIRKTVAMAEIGEAVQQGFAKIMGAVTAAGAQPTGMPFVVYHTMDPTAPEWEVEVCMPVEGPFEGGGEVVAADVPGGTMAWTIHQGPYDEIGPAYEAFALWAAERGRSFAGAPRELYLNDPSESGPDTALTEIQWPVT